MKGFVQASAVAALALLSGCYTQLAVVNRSAPPQGAPCPDSLQDSCAQARAEAREGADTVVVRDDEREVCYWDRNWWGEPVLRCYRTYYSGSWIAYYNDPWWYNRHRYSWGYDRCPSYYYYDPYTGYCRHHRDYDIYYVPARPSSGSSGSGSSAGSSKPRPRRTLHPGTVKSGEETSSQPASKRSTSEPKSGYVGGSGGAVTSPSSVPASRKRGSTSPASESAAPTSSKKSRGSVSAEDPTAKEGGKRAKPAPSEGRTKRKPAPSKGDTQVKPAPEPQKTNETSDEREDSQQSGGRKRRTLR